jgi:hypothetical protein
MELISLLVAFVLGAAVIFSPALIALYWNLGLVWVFYLVPLPVLLLNANLRNIQFARNVAQRRGAGAAFGHVALRLVSLAAASAVLNTLAYLALA